MSSLPQPFGVRAMIWAILSSPWLVAAFAASESRIYNDLVLHEERDGGGMDWSKGGRVQGGLVLPLRIGLKQRNLENAEKYVWDVADPDSPNYGRHWTAQQVAETFAPAKESVDAAMHWLEEHGIVPNRTRQINGWIKVNATVAEVENLLKAEYHVFKHVEGDVKRVACDGYSLPRDLREHIDFVMPTTQLDGPRRPSVSGRDADLLDTGIHDSHSSDRSELVPVHDQKNTALTNSLEIPDLPPWAQGLTGLENCHKLITIDCLRALYNFGSANHSDEMNQLGLFESNGQQDKCGHYTFCANAAQMMSTCRI
ncbi:Tripeptidyl-peptidase sed1 [Fulvia fulva]|nr:Tripeptidyl-peptidase sed1 [Fulvia fulva]WPV25728.1 Tripeptidyl-peptidase sed1 [Fulvia fulva]